MESAAHLVHAFRVIVSPHGLVLRDDLLKSLIQDQKSFVICTAGNVCYLLVMNF